MFTESNIVSNEALEKTLAKLMKDRDFEELEHNEVSVGIFVYNNVTPTDVGGRIQIATELEKTMGYDAVIYINDDFLTFCDEQDIEAYIYQLLLSISPVVVGRENARIIKLEKEIGVRVSRETVRRYGREINWYRELYAG